MKIRDIVQEGTPGPVYYEIVEVEENRLMLLFATTHIKYIVSQFVNNISQRSLSLGFHYPTWRDQLRMIDQFVACSKSSRKQIISPLTVY